MLNQQPLTAVRVSFVVLYHSRSGQSTREPKRWLGRPPPHCFTGATSRTRASADARRAQQRMEVTGSSGRHRAVAAGSGGAVKRRSVDVGTGGSIRSLGTDLLCIVFALLDHFDLIRCSVVCKSWFVSLSC